MPPEDKGEEKPVPRSSGTTSRGSARGETATSRLLGVDSSLVKVLARTVQVPVAARGPAHPHPRVYQRLTGARVVVKTVSGGELIRN